MFLSAKGKQYCLVRELTRERERESDQIME